MQYKLSNKFGQPACFTNNELANAINYNIPFDKQLNSSGTRHHLRWEILSPELLNRIDKTVIFNQLQRKNMDDIAQIQLEYISKQLIEWNNMTVDISDLALACIAENGYDEVRS
jgi:ATP-dependent Clp protease ATP-binding subunit ClpA